MAKKILCFLMAFCMLFTFVACNKGETPEDPNKNEDGAATYGIYFYTGNSAKVEPMLGIKAGAKISKPKDPTAVGSRFVGWYTDPSLNNEFVWDVMPAEDIILYAKWEQTVDNAELAAYEAALDANSENGHLYIHYMRFDNDPDAYAKMSLWVWPKAYTGRTFNWSKDNQGKVVVDEIGGAVCDIDLTKYYTDAGNGGNEKQQYFKDGFYGSNYKPEYIKDPTKYNDPEIGFLIVYDDSKDKGGHWLSDGGNQFFTIANAVRDNGAIHLFATQDNVGDFVFKIADKGIIDNPYENDDGTHVSKGDINSSEKSFAQLSKTANPANLFDTVSGVGYQIMVSSFADSNGDGYGDIRGIIDNLDYLDKTLNVDVLWLTPIQLSDSYHGYDIIDYCSVDPKFGTLDDYKELLTKCHARGMKVVMDLVLNHTSINNVWFQKSAKMTVENGVDYRNFYHWRNHTKTSLSAAWYQYSEYNYSYYGKFGSSMPELNYDYSGTRNAILDVARYWMTVLGDQGGVDGFRIDAVKHIYMEDEVTAGANDIIISDYDTATKTDYSTNVTKNLNFFCWLIDGIKKINPNAYVVGENFDGHAYNVSPYYKAFDGMLDFYMYYNLAEIACHMGYAAGVAGAASNTDGSTPSGKNTNQLKGGAWNYAAVSNTNAQYGYQFDSLFTSNHDVPRLINNVYRSYSGPNWTAGTISSSNSTEAIKRAKAVFIATMMLPGVSWIYYGDELGMSSNYGTGESKTSPHVDRWYRQPFKWTTTAAGSKYTTSYSIAGDKTYYVEWDNYNKTLQGVAEQLNNSNSFLNEVKKWTKLKSEDNVIRYGNYAYRSAGGGDVFAFTRSYGGKTYLVACNFGTSTSNLGVSGTVICSTNGASTSSLPSGGCIVVKIAG